MHGLAKLPGSTGAGVFKQGDNSFAQPCTLFPQITPFHLASLISHHPNVTQIERVGEGREGVVIGLGVGSGEWRYKSYRTHATVENKIESFSSRFSIFYDSMSSDCDLYHAPSFKKLKAESFIPVLLCLLLFVFGTWYKYVTFRDREIYPNQDEKISRARRICLTMATAMKTSQADWASIEQERVFSHFLLPHRGGRFWRPWAKLKTFHLYRSQRETQ